MRPSADLQTSSVRKTSVEPVIPQEKKAEFQAAFQQQQQRSRDDSRKGQSSVWGPTFKDRQHFNEMHFC